MVAKIDNLVVKSPKMMPAWLYPQDFARFPVNSHYSLVGRAREKTAKDFCTCVSPIRDDILTSSATIAQSAFNQGFRQKERQMRKLVLEQFTTAALKW
ncbi:hypothetical protein TNCV_3991051 [Trichonephila clavipes]|uniref:Uncharacterized protein n=1 Tax=Trichonephila clavipes TaxID=2585209 RepID=A0A8X6SZJ4_TRICX|nr:hypothetical protein TNCV_3991051 [Trichonephila clavipes]